MTDLPNNMPTSNMPSNGAGGPASAPGIGAGAVPGTTPGVGTPASLNAPSNAGATAAAAASARVEEERKKKRKRRILIILLLLLLLAVAGVGAFFALSQPENLYDDGTLEGIAPNKTQAEIQAELNRVVDESMFDISIASVIESTDGKTGKAYIENVPGNHYDLKVSLVPEDQDDPIFESKLVAPGNYFEDITFAYPLDDGMHQAVAHFTAFDRESHEEIGAVDAQVVISVGESTEGGDE